MAFSRIKRRIIKMVTGGRRRRVKNDPVRLELQKTREVYARKQKHDYSHLFRFDIFTQTMIIS